MACRVAPARIIRVNSEATTSLTHETTATRSAQGTTRFISSRNSRVRFAVKFNPKSACFIVHFVAVSARLHKQVCGRLMQRILKRWANGNFVARPPRKCTGVQEPSSLFPPETRHLRHLHGDRIKTKFDYFSFGLSTPAFTRGSEAGASDWTLR